MLPAPLFARRARHRVRDRPAHPPLCSQTKKTTWKKPADFTAPSPKKPRESVAPGTEFWERTDKKSGRKYYIHTKTRKTTWKLPSGGVVVEKVKKSKPLAQQATVAAASAYPVKDLQESVQINRTGDVTIRERGTGLDETVQVGHSGDIDIKERNAAVHVGKRGSIDIIARANAHAASAAAPAPAPVVASAAVASAVPLPATGAAAAKVHVSKRGSVDIQEGNETARSRAPIARLSALSAVVAEPRARGVGAEHPPRMWT